MFVEYINTAAAEAAVEPKGRAKKELEKKKHSRNRGSMRLGLGGGWWKRKNEINLFFCRARTNTGRGSAEETFKK